ncbi:MAG: hypothetical protein FJX76_13265 [Armatimonadetes bacterium]|nr:hypothetical protein [Armatimonadota bacterium]
MPSAQQHTIAERFWERNRKRIISLFITINLVTTVLWLVQGAVPYPVRRLTGYYVFFTGLWQRWPPFAPNPPTTSTALRGQFQYKDGSRSAWDFPQVRGMNVFEALVETRTRDWQLNVTSDSQLWTDTGLWLVTWHADKSKPVYRVSIVRRSMSIPPPGPTDFQPRIPLQAFTDEAEFYGLRL